MLQQIIIKKAGIEKLKEDNDDDGGGVLAPTIISLVILVLIFKIILVMIPALVMIHFSSHFIPKKFVILEFNT